MKRALLSLSFLVVLSPLSFGQTDSLPPFPTPEWRLGSEPMIGVIGDMSVNSSGLTTAFYKPFVRGGHIDRDLKERTLEGMEEVNRFGGDRTFSIGGSFSPDTLFGQANKDRNIFFRLIDGSHYNARFTRDLFRTIFFGNANAKDRLELAPFSMNSMRYRQFKIGLLDQRAPFELGIAISAFQGIRDLRIEAGKAYLEGGNAREELRFRMQGGVFRHGRMGRTRIWEFPGSGIGIDIMGGYDFGELGQIRASIRDMGLLHWGPSARVQEVDTSLTFQGFNIEDPLGGGELGSNASVDSLEQRYLPKTKEGNYRHLFPGRIRLAYMKRFPSDIWFRSHFRHRPFTPHVPYFGLEVMKAWNGFRAGISGGYGGFGELAFGVQFAYRSGKNWDLYLRAPHLEGLLIPNSMGGLQASVGLHYHY